MERLRQYAQNAAIHGVKDFLTIDYIWARILWVIFMIFCMITMIYETYALLIQYVDEPTATQVRQKYLATYPYPRMIFCPKQWINESIVAELNISKPLLVYALSLLRRVALEPIDKESISPDIDRLRQEFDQLLVANKFRNHIDFFTVIANNPFAVSQCDQCVIMTNQVIASGVCIQFKPFSATSDQLIKLSPTFRYRDLNLNNIDNSTVPLYSGYFDTDSIYISFKPQHDFFAYDPIILNRNHSYVLRIKPTNYQRLNKPDRRCATIEKVKREKYSQVMCYFNCDERYKSACRGCTYLNYNFDDIIEIDDGRNRSIFNTTVSPEIPYCSTLDADTPEPDSCAQMSDSKLTDCVKTCEPLCNEWVYETSAVPVSQRKLISTHEEADITIAISYQVRYGETFIEEVQTYSWETFLSNIGGQLGLWTGASAVTVLQLLHLLAEFLYYDLNPFRRLLRITNGLADQQPTAQSSLDASPQELTEGNAIYSTRVGLYDWTNSAFDRQSNTTGTLRKTSSCEHAGNRNGAAAGISVYEV